MVTLEKQSNYALAVAQGFERVRARSPEELAALGAESLGVGHYALPVLDGAFVIDLGAEAIRPADRDLGVIPSKVVRPAWQILSLHYLSAQMPACEAAEWVSFADLVDARGYEQVYRGRVLGRLCGTAGRTRGKFLAACDKVGAQHVVWGDEGFQFEVFPRLRVIIAWYDGDGELPPAASMVYPANILSFLPVEDVVVLSERLVGRLQGEEW